MRDVDQAGKTTEMGRARLLRRVNERAVFDLLLTRPDWSRSELTRQLGLTIPTIHKAVARLKAAGLVREVHVSSSPVAKVLPGRRSLRFGVGTSSARVLGFTVAAESVRWTSANLEGASSYARNAAGPLLSSYDGLLRLLASEVMIACNSEPRVVAIGVSVCATIGADGVVLAAPRLNYLIGKRLAADLETLVKIPVATFCKTAGWSYAELAATPHEQSVRHFVTMSIDDEVRASVVCEGRLLGGERAPGSDLGHLRAEGSNTICTCGSTGCLHATVTESAIARRISEGAGRAVSFDDLVRAPQSFEPHLSAAMSAACEAMADGIATIVRLFRPQAVLIASRLFDLQPNSISPLDAAVARRLGRTSAGRCELRRIAGDDLRGAIGGAIRHFQERLGPTI